MEFRQLLTKRRTIRSFKQIPVTDESLSLLIDAARCASCAANLQRLRYVVVRTPQMVSQILPHTAWGGYVKPRRTPRWGVDAPGAFILVLAPKETPVEFIHADAGAAIQSMELAAADAGLGACWMGAIQRPEICAIVGVDTDQQQLLYVVAVGVPAEYPVMEESTDPAQIKYYLDEENTIHVPKLTKEILVNKWL